MKIENNKVVELIYELNVDGKVVDKVDESKPLDFIFGMGMLIPKFEEEILGMQAGDSFDIHISKEQGYGEYKEEYKFDIPMSSFEIDGKVDPELLKVGRIIPMLNSSNQVCNGIVSEIKEDSVTMDFNHPMSGKDLHFTGKILNVREATEKELRDGLHGEFVESECCCGDHGCGCGNHDHEHGCGCHEHEHECGCHEDHHECGCHEDHHEHGKCCGKHKN